MVIIDALLLCTVPRKITAITTCCFQMHSALYFISSMRCNMSSDGNMHTLTEVSPIDPQSYFLMPISRTGNHLLFGLPCSNDKGEERKQETKRVPVLACPGLLLPLLPPFPFLSSLKARQDELSFTPLLSCLLLLPDPSLANSLTFAVSSPHLHHHRLLSASAQDHQNGLPPLFFFFQLFVN